MAGLIFSVLSLLTVPLTMVICGRIWLISGIVTLVIALLGGVLAVVMGMETNEGLYNVILIEEAVQLAFLLGAIPLTEYRLKKMFHI